jgi:hypothetical protein
VHKSLFNDEPLLALSDIGVLLEYLGREPDARLQGCFSDTRQSKGQANVIVKPPSKTYTEFLNRIYTIQAQYDSRGKFEDHRSDAVELIDKAFVFWARDFLSALSAPATADSIRITNSYMNQRFDGRGKTVADQYQMFASKTVGTIKWLQGYAVVTALLIVIISIYALAGHQILAAREAAIANFGQINSKIALTQRQGHSQIVNPDLAGYLESRQVKNDKTRSIDLLTSVRDENKKDSSGEFFLCDNIDVTTKSTTPRDLPGFVDIKTPSTGPISSGYYYYYSSLDEIGLCQERKRILYQLLAAGEQLISWQRAITNPLPILLPPSQKSEVVVGGNLPEMVASAESESGFPAIGRHRIKLFHKL